MLKENFKLKILLFDIQRNAVSTYAVCNFGKRLEEDGEGVEIKYPSK